MKNKSTLWYFLFVYWHFKNVYIAFIIKFDVFRTKLKDLFKYSSNV